MKTPAPFISTRSPLSRRKFLRGARILLTGGTGFFGCWLLETLVRANERFDLGAAAHRGVSWEIAAVDYGAALLEQHGAPRSGPAS